MPRASRGRHVPSLMVFCKVWVSGERSKRPPLPQEQKPDWLDRKALSPAVSRTPPGVRRRRLDENQGVFEKRQSTRRGLLARTEYPHRKLVRECLQTAVEIYRGRLLHSFLRDPG